MQKKQLDFSPADGKRIPRSFDWTAEGWRNAHCYTTWGYNPWTGLIRDPSDVATDPKGLLIHDGTSDVKTFMNPNHPYTPDARLCEQVIGKHRSDYAACLDPTDCTKYARCKRGVPEADTPAAAREALHDWAEREPDVLPDTLTATLRDRGAKYGKFADHAAVTQSLKYTMYQQPKWENLADDQKEGLEMIVHKIGRILNGDPNYADSWVDIAGYARLVADRLGGVVR